jgi:hypothetical protein
VADRDIVRVTLALTQVESAYFITEVCSVLTAGTELIYTALTHTRRWGLGHGE